MQRERRLAEVMVEEKDTKDMERAKAKGMDAKVERKEVKVKAESQEQRKEEKTKVAKQSLVEMCVGFASNPDIGGMNAPTGGT